MAFDPKKYLIKLQGNRQYLPVSARLVWFRETHPDWGIETKAIVLDLEKQTAVFEASIYNAESRLMAKGTKMEDAVGFSDYVEKAETGAIGRALAMCGFGTQFAPELDEYSAGRFVDSPLSQDEAAPQEKNGAAPDQANGKKYDDARGSRPGKIVCSSCGRELTTSQEVLSMRKFGVALCPNCQKERRSA